MFSSSQPSSLRPVAVFSFSHSPPPVVSSLSTFRSRFHRFPLPLDRSARNRYFRQFPPFLLPSALTLSLSRLLLHIQRGACLPLPNLCSILILEHKPLSLFSLADRFIIFSHSLPFVVSFFSRLLIVCGADECIAFVACGLLFLINDTFLFPLFPKRYESPLIPYRRFVAERRGFFRRAD